MKLQKKAVPNMTGVYITTEGRVTINNGSPLQEYIQKTGCFVKIRKKRKVTTFLVRDLLTLTFPNEKAPLSDIIQFIRTIKWVTIHTKLAKDHVKIKVLFQGMGVMKTDKLDIYSLYDAQKFFSEKSILAKRWRPNKRSYL